MAEKEATVGFEEGIHGRPASELVKTAKRFSSEVRVINGEREANAKSPLQVTAFAKKGDTILFRAEGEDEEEAVEALAKLVSRSEH